ncbi:MAG: ATP-dependent DNA helicase, partial [Mesobacillus sp.]
VFSHNIPFVFSSATLSQAGDFSYIAKSLGIEKYTSFTVASPFDYEEQMELVAHIEDDEVKKWCKIGDDLISKKGSSLVLFSSMEEMERFRAWSENQEWSFTILFEGDREISETVKEFQTDIETVLCSYSLWEGLDVPGESLIQVIIASLPFPPHDPVFQAKRKHAQNPAQEVDIPYMLLRLRQGMGRLIRTNQDSGTVHIWLTQNQKAAHFEKLKDVLPVQPIHWK